jgi:hypothetical protein
LIFQFHLNETFANVTRPTRYFSAHREKILWIGSYRSTSTLASLDASGLLVVWPYQPFAYNGFGWYEPAKSAQIDLAMPSLVAPDLLAAKKSGGAQAVAALESEVFPVLPVKKLSDGAAASSSSSFLLASKNAKARFDGLVSSGRVAAEPWYSSPPTVNGWKQYHLEADKHHDGSSSSSKSMHVLVYDVNGDLLQHKIQQARPASSSSSSSSARPPPPLLTMLCSFPPGSITAASSPFAPTPSARSSSFSFSSTRSRQNLLISKS